MTCALTAGMIYNFAHLIISQESHSLSLSLSCSPLQFVGAVEWPILARTLLARVESRWSLYLGATTLQIVSATPPRSAGAEPPMSEDDRAPNEEEEEEVEGANQIF